MSIRDEQFYKKHFRDYFKDNGLNKLKSNKLQIPHHFEKNARYRICVDSLNKNKNIGRNLIVELGCAKGESLKYLKNTYGFQSGIGCDFIFNETINNNNCKFFSADLNQKWPIPDSKVDCFIAMMLFEHLFDPWFCFAEVKRVLSSEGRAFINLPLVTGFKNRLRLFFGKLPITSVPYRKWEKEGHWDGFHLHYFNLSSINDLVKKYDLKILSKTAVGKYKTLKNLYPSLLCTEISLEITHAN